ncbi:MAG: hypothetical protein V1800_04815 [Candidatus Latescibacterota bacterium]
MIIRLTWIAVLCILGGCRSAGVEKTPVEKTYDQVARLVTRSEEQGGVYVQVAFRTFTFEVMRLCMEAERGGWTDEQLESQTRSIVTSFAESEYPSGDGGIAGFYKLYGKGYGALDLSNPMEKRQYEMLRNRYVQKVSDRVFDKNYPRLRARYNDEWGYPQYGRLVFSVYVENRGGQPEPVVDLGSRTFLEDETGNRYPARGTAGAYPYLFDMPQFDRLETSDRYRVFFVNRRLGENRPIIEEETAFVKLVITGLGAVPERAFVWDLPLGYPKLPSETATADTLRKNVRF